MSVMTFEGVIENGRIKLNTNVLLPENAKVYVVVPGDDIEPESPVYDLSSVEHDQEWGERIVRIYSPRIAHLVARQTSN